MIRNSCTGHISVASAPLSTQGLSRHMHIAVFCRSRTLGKVLGLHHSITDTRNRKLSGSRAGCSARDIVRHLKALVFQILMKPRHNFTPDIQMVTPLFSLRQTVVIVISSPDTCRIVGSIAHKPDVVVIGGRTGLSGDGHTGESGPRSCSGPHHILHGARQQPRCAVL